MGWADWPWYTTADDFSADFDVSEYFGINVFVRDGDQIHRSYFTTARAAEELSSVWGAARHHAVRPPRGMAGRTRRRPADPRAHGRADTTNTAPRSWIVAAPAVEVGGAARSRRLRTRWSGHDVRFHGTGIKRMHHPVVGQLSLSFNPLDDSADPGLTVLAYVAEPGSRDDQALKLLALPPRRWTRSPRGRRPAPEPWADPAPTHSVSAARHSSALTGRPR